MSNGSFMYAGHAIGAAARFNRLYDKQNLNHATPTLGASVLPVTGGRSAAHVDPYRYDVTDPRPLCLLSVDGIDTWAEGRETATGWETELSIDISGLKVVEKLHIDSIRLHMLTGHTSSGDPVVTTQGNRIDGMRLGNVAVLVTFDDAQLGYACTADRFASYYQGLGRQLGQVGDYYSSTLARDIQLIGSEQDKQGMSVSGNVITWEGFGRVILGEIHVKGHERRLTMVRLAMGSDAGGSGSAGDGQGNGTPVG